MSLQRSLKALMTLVPRNDIRYYFNGVHVMFIPEKNCWYLEATDGHRAARIELPNTVSYIKHFSFNQPCELIIPRGIIADVLRGTDDKTSISLIFTDMNHALIRKGGQTFTFNPIDGRYPNLNRVFPKEGRPSFSPNGIAVSGSYLGDVGKFVNALKSSSYGSVVMKTGMPDEIVQFDVRSSDNSDYSKITYLLSPMRMDDKKEAA